jgi:hypothetical protein
MFAWGNRLCPARRSDPRTTAVILPTRPQGDVFAKPGEFPAVRARIRKLAAGLDIPSVVTYAFDFRTRILPFLFADRRMVPAGVRMIGSTLYDSGLHNTRIVLQHWTPNFRPSHARLGGQPPEMILIGSMQIHCQPAYRLIADACQIPRAERPLIIAGGPKAIYEPWDLFAIGGDPRVSADVAVTGEAFVFAQFLEVLMDYRRSGGTMRQAFERARRDGALNEVLGLVYQPDPSSNGGDSLVSTGVQRIVRDLDELPFALDGFRLIEPPHRNETLSPAPLPLNRLWRYGPIAPLVMTQGCKFHCDFCPIPLFNQRSFRNKSGQRLAEEMKAIVQNTGIHHFFGTCDNFFNNRQRAEEMLEVLAHTEWDGRRLKNHLRWGTESTQFDAYKSLDLMQLARRAGMRAVWFGIEDLTGALVRKGQKPDQARELFAELTRVGISPMPMMVHHDKQPLLSRGNLSGLINQVVYLRKAGAISMQITMLTPSVGSPSCDKVYNDGLVFDSVDGRQIEHWQIDGNHVVATSSKSPWLVQLRLLAGYVAFYNPLNFLWSLIRPSRRLFLIEAGVQVVGMYALARTAVENLRWAFRLWWGPIKRRTSPPEQAWKLVAPSDLPPPAPGAEKTPSGEHAMTR